MASGEIRIGDYGTRFIGRVSSDGSILDISSISASTFMYFRKPDDNLIRVSGTLFNDGKDGKFYYRAGSGFIDQDGIWSYQGEVMLGANKIRSDVEKFKVYSNLEV